jgi:hypothetical protein
MRIQGGSFTGLRFVNPVPWSTGSSGHCYMSVDGAGQMSMKLHSLSFLVTSMRCIVWLAVVLYAVLQLRQYCVVNGIDIDR